MQLGVPALLLHDNKSAAELAFGDAHDSRQLELTKACLSMQHWLRATQRSIARRHVAAHSGHPLNDFVDCAAKQAALNNFVWEPSSALVTAQEQSVLPWLWVACGLCPALPLPDSAGTLYDAGCHFVPEAPLALHFQHQLPAPAQEIHFRCRIVTYNALSLSSLIARESADHQFHAMQATVVGVQEARHDTGPRGQTLHYHILSSRPDRGQLGCQIWLHKTLPAATASGHELAWDPHSFAVISASPRHLLVSAKAGHVAFAFLAAHAPTSAAPDATLRDWWDRLDSLVKCIPPRHTPVFLLDSNARFGWGMQAPDGKSAINSNAPAYG